MKTPILDLLVQSRVPHRMPGEHHHATHGRVQVDCPWCSPRSDKWRLGIHLDGSRSHCWTCGFHPVVEALVRLTSLSYPDCQAILEGLPRTPRLERPEGKLVLPAGLGPLGIAHTRYLRGRGLDPGEVLRVWGIGGLGRSGSLPWRIWIPIRSRDGEVVSWTTRSLSDRVASRYLSAEPHQERLHHKTLLYGEEYCSHAIIIVEGPLDVWKIGPGAVAVLGLSITRAQVLRMASYPTRVICFDNEPDAQRRAGKLAEQLQGFAGTTYRVLLDAKDPGSASERELRKLREFLK